MWERIENVIRLWFYDLIVKKFYKTVFNVSVGVVFNNYSTIYQFLRNPTTKQATSDDGINAITGKDCPKKYICE